MEKLIACYNLAAALNPTETMKETADIDMLPKQFDE